MWTKIIAINKMNQELAESIQKKKKLRHKLKEMKQKQERQKMVCNYDKINGDS